MALPGLGFAKLLSSRYSSRPRLVQLVLSLALLLVSLTVFGLATFQVRGYESSIARTSFTLQGAVPLPVVQYTPLQHRLNVVAVIAHGYSADKEMMSGLAVDLAAQGITAYTFDFPGHGASTVPYGGQTHTGVVKQLVASVGEMTDYALARAGNTHPRLVLIGYSLGTIAVGDYALQHPTLSNLQATVLVAGILQDQPTVTNPRNLLVLSGQFDLPGINDISRQLIASGCGVPTSRVADTFQCGTAAALAPTMRERVVLNGLDHISIITAGSTHATILRWLGTTVDPAINARGVIADARMHWLLLGFLAAAVGALALLSGASTVLGLSPASVARRSSDGRHGKDGGDGSGPPAEHIWPGWKPLAVIAGSLAITLLVTRLWLPSDFWASEPAPFGFLKQQVSADVAVFLLVAGAVLLGALRVIPAWRARARWPSLSSAVTQLPLALVVVVFLYFTLGKLSSLGWESLALSPARLWHAAVYAVMVWPFFLGMRALLAGNERLMRHPVLADLAVTLLLLVSFGGAIAMNFGRLSYLGILLPIIVLFLFAFVGFAAWTRRVTYQPILLISATQALLMGWLLAATLPLVS